MAIAKIASIGRPLTDNAADTVRGIGLAVAAYFILTMGDATAKWVTLSGGISAVLLGRGLLGASTAAAWAMGRNGPRGWRRIVPVRWVRVMLRGSLAACSTVTWYYAWTYMQLADTYALGFTAPLMMTLLAIPMLGERIRWRRVLSTLVGFSGVMVMLRPGGHMWNPASPVLCAGIVAMAVTRIMARQLSRTETPECQAFWLMLWQSAAGILLLGVFPIGPMHGIGVWFALVFLGISSGLAHSIFALAYGMAPVSALAPYEYTMLIWGGAAGFLAFHEVPAWTTMIGAAIVAAAGLYNLHRERVRMRHP